jgi:hypothetical protein
MTNESARDEPGTPRVEQESSQVGEKGPAFGFWLATIALVLVSLVASFAMFIFKDVFQNATDVTTVLSPCLLSSAPWLALTSVSRLVVTRGTNCKARSTKQTRLPIEPSPRWLRKQAGAL